MHQYATLLQAALVDGEEVVTITADNEATAGTYKVSYINNNGKDTVSVTVEGTDGKYTAAALDTENKTLTAIINKMLIGENEKIENSTLSATLTDAGVLTLHYVHHSNAGVDWTFTY